MTATATATATQKLISSFDPRRAADLCRDLLANAGITVNGNQPWDMQVKDERLWTRILRDGTLGVGETYVEGWWDVEALDQFVDRAVRARIGDTLRDNWMLLPHIVRARVLNL